MARGSKPGERRGGRAKGTPNKVTKDVRAAIAKVAEANADSMSTWLGEIDDPARRLELFLRLLEYHVPKLSRAEVTGKDGQSVVIEIHKISGGEPPCA